MSSKFQDKCPTCGGSCDNPAARARIAGFNSSEHCIMLANRLGLVVPCTMFGQLGYRYCGRGCPIYKKYVEESASGKVKEKFRDPGNKTDES
jgi:hypothetical protein